MTFFGCVPVIMNPPIRTLSPVSTRKRVEMLARVVGVAVGVGVGVAPSNSVESPALLVNVAALAVTE